MQLGLTDTVFVDIVLALLLMRMMTLPLQITATPGRRQKAILLTPGGQSTEMQLATPSTTATLCCNRAAAPRQYDGGGSTLPVVVNV